MPLNNIYYVARTEICSGFAYSRNKPCLPYGNMLQNGETNMLIELLFSCNCEFVYLFLSSQPFPFVLYFSAPQIIIRMFPLWVTEHADDQIPTLNMLIIENHSYSCKNIIPKCQTQVSLNLSYCDITT